MKKINTIVKSDTPPVTGDEALWVDTSKGDNSIKLKVKGDGGKYTEVSPTEDKEDKANKVTSIEADADDAHYPSAKAVWLAIEGIKQMVGDVESILATING